MAVQHHRLSLKNHLCQGFAAAVTEHHDDGVLVSRLVQHLGYPLSEPAYLIHRAHIVYNNKGYFVPKYLVT